MYNIRKDLRKEFEKKGLFSPVSENDIKEYLKHTSRNIEKDLKNLINSKILYVAEIPSETVQNEQNKSFGAERSETKGSPVIKIVRVGDGTQY